MKIHGGKGKKDVPGELVLGIVAIPEGRQTIATERYNNPIRWSSQQNRPGGNEELEVARGLSPASG